MPSTTDIVLNGYPFKIQYTCKNRDCRCSYVTVAMSYSRDLLCPNCSAKMEPLVLGKADES